MKPTLKMADEQKVVEEDVDALLKKANEDPDETVRAEANKSLYERTKKAEAALKELKSQAPKTEEKPPISAPSRDELDTVLDLQSKGYTPAEIRKARDYAKRLSMPIDEVLNDEIIKAGFEAERAKIKVDRATPPPSGRTVPYKGAGKMSEAKTRDEREAAFGEIMNTDGGSE